MLLLDKCVAMFISDLGLTTIMEITKLYRARQGSPSLKTTVPQEVVEELNLQSAAYIAWQVEELNGEKFVSIRPITVQ